MTTHAPRRAAIYVRLSRYRGVDDPTTSPARQREACEAYIRAQGWELYHVFEDLDVSGGEEGLRLDRPGLREAREMFGEYDVLVFLKLDRLARSVVDFSTFAGLAQKAGVDVVSVRDGLDLSTSGGRFVAQILSAFAELELATIKERTRDGKRKSAEMGRWQGGRSLPYGYRLDDRRLTLDEGEAEILRDAAQRLVAGESLGGVTRHVESSTLRPRHSAKWATTPLKRALTSQHAPEILGPGLAELVREALAENRAWPKTTNPSLLLSGLLRCAMCDRAMYAARRRARVDGTPGPSTYRCSNVHCRKVSIAAAGLDAWIEERYLDAFADQDETRAVRVATERHARIAELADDVAALRGTLGVLPVAELAGAAGRLAALEIELAGLRARPAMGETKIVQTGRTYGEAWTAGGLDDQREALRTSLAPSHYLVIGPGRSGVRGFQEERVLDLWKVRAWADA